MTDAPPIVVSVRALGQRPVPNSVKRPCAGNCGFSVWLSQDALDRIAEHPGMLPYCSTCALPLIEKDENPKIDTTDGTPVEVVLAFIQAFGWPNEGV